MKFKCLTDSGNVRLREAPSFSASVIGKCLRGEVYESASWVEGDGKKWLCINNGYACADYFVPLETEEYLLSFTREELLTIKEYIERVLAQ